MAYGDYNGPDKPNKGHEGGACNRQRCQAEPALWYNHGSHSWYCEDCAKDIGHDRVNEPAWIANFSRYYPRREYHPMFETREQMTAREEREAPNKEMITDFFAEIDHADIFGDRRQKPQSASLKRMLGKAPRRAAGGRR